MLKFSFSILFVCIYISSFGQQLFPNDSIIWDLPAQQKLGFHYTNPQLIKTQLKDYNIGEADLTFRYKKGDYRHAKEAYLQQSIDFNAHGISQIDQFIISGQFKFNRIWEDSLANTLQGINDNLSPFYYFVEKSGKYERQNFKGNVQIRYAGISRYIQTGLKLDYDLHWTTRSVDPRPNVGSFALKFSPFLSAEIGKNMLSASALFGYGDEESAMMYKNKMYALSMLYPERLHYSNQGFGYISQMDSSEMRKYDQFLGANLAYSFQDEGFELYTSLNFERKTTMSTYDLKLRKNYYKRNEFTLNSFHSTMQIHWKQEAKKQHLLQLDIRQQEGQDLNYNLRATNYLVTHRHIDLAYYYQQKNWVWGLSGFWSLMDKQDAAAAHQHAYQQLKVQLPIRHIFSSGKNIIETELIPNYTWKLSNKLNVPQTQINVFTKSIVFPNYDYINLEPIGIEFNLSYVLPKVLKTRAVKIYLYNQFLTVLGSPNKTNLSLKKDKYSLWQTKIGTSFSL